MTLRPAFEALSARSNCRSDCETVADLESVTAVVQIDYTRFLLARHHAFECGKLRVDIGIVVIDHLFENRELGFPIFPPAALFVNDRAAERCDFYDSGPAPAHC